VADWRRAHERVSSDIAPKTNIQMAAYYPRVAKLFLV
jgi:hypothetical protein